MDTDKNFWHLLDPNFDKIAELPSAASHFKFILNEPGSGSLNIPMTSNAASLVSSGMFARSSYRGAVRGGFSIDNIKEDFTIEGNVDGGLWMNLSGSGELILLEDGIVYSGGDGTTSTRTFTGTKAAAFITLIDEAKARTGCLADVTYDFTASVDSDGVGWTDTDSFTVTVGVTLLEVMRQIVKFGIDFKMSFVGGSFVLSAYKNGIGEDVSSTVFFRVGHNCTMVSSDERGGGLKNALLLAFKDGSVSLKDDASITAYRRREKFINAENAQDTSAVTTYGSALLEGLKDPKRSIAVKVYDGVAPNLFLDYGMGYTVSLDIEGVIETHRVLGIQCDWDGVNYSNVTLELNALLHEHELKMAQDIEWLLSQWNTARDSDLLAVTYWAAIGDANITYNVSDFCIIGDYLYLINGSTTILKYGLKDGIWYPIVLTALPTCMAAVGTNLYVGGALQVIKYDTLTDTQTYVNVGGGLGASVNSLAVNGTTLYAAGEFTSINSVAATNIAQLNTLTSTWSSMADQASFLMTVPALSVMLYSNGLLYSSAGTQVQAWNGTVWANVGSSFGGNVLTFAEYGTSLLMGGQMTSGIHIWDGVSWAVFGGGVNDAVRAIGVYLTDVYIGGSFTDAGSYVAKYSGGEWWQLDSGVNALVDNLILNGQDLYVAGDFTAVGSTSKPAQGIAAYFNTFESLVDYLENSSSSFNMGAAIHAASASAITDTDEVPFWEASVNALRKITWANIKATLKTYFDTLYVALTGAQTIAGVKTFSSDPIIPDEVYDATNWNGSLEPPTKNAVRDKIESMGGGGTPGGSDSHVQYNNGGAFGGEADFAWEDVTKTFLVGGSNWYSALSALTGGIHVSKDAGGAFTNIVTGHSWVDSVDDFTGVPAFGADRAGGSRATPTAVLDNMGLARFTGGGYDGTTLSGTRAQVLLRAAGNWSGTSHPTKIELWTTPSGSVTRRKVLTVGENGNVDILTGKTYNINGSPHTHAHNDATSLQGGTAGEYYHLTSADNTEAVAFLNGGTGTHTAMDAHIAALSGANAHNMREVLTAARTYYVRTDGNDANTGLANTAGGAFLTIQKAVDTIALLDINAKTVTVQVADGTYTGAIVLKNCVGFAVAGNLVIQGNSTTPANVVISMAGNCFTADGLNVVWDIKDMKISSSAGNCIFSTNNSLVRFTNLDFGVSVIHIHGRYGGKVLAIGNFKISGSATFHAFAGWGGGVVDVVGFTVTLSGTPAFTNFAYATSVSMIRYSGNTFSGSATGSRYYVEANAVIHTVAATLPGNAAGSTATGGQYI